MEAAEPYVADPAEPTPPPAAVRLRPVVVSLALAVLVAALVFTVYSGVGRQDPALDAPGVETQP